VSKKSQQQRREHRRAEARQARDRARRRARAETERRRAARMLVPHATLASRLLGSTEQRRAAYERARAERDDDDGCVEVLECSAERLHARVYERFRGGFDAYLLCAEETLLAYCTCDPGPRAMACRHLWASLHAARRQGGLVGFAELPAERLGRLPWRFLEQPPAGDWIEPEPPPPRCDLPPPRAEEIEQPGGSPIVRLAPDAMGSGIAVLAGTTYGSATVPLGMVGDPVHHEGGWFRRDAAVERRALRDLMDLGLPLRAGLARRVEELGEGAERADAPAELRHVEWLPLARIPAGKAEPLVSKLLDAGWTVEGEAMRYRRGTTASLRLVARPGASWLEGDAHFGDIGLDACRLLAAIRQGRRFVRLGNGDVGVLPQAWLERWGLVAAAVPGTAGPEGVVELGGARAEAVALLLTAAEAPEGDRATDPAVEARSADDVAILARWASVPSRGPLAEAEPSPAFVGELRPYQRQGLAWLRSRRAERRGGALCDEMGLGKTVQLLAHVSSVDAGSAPTLVVAPTSLLGNWTREIARFVPGLRVVVHAGPERARDVSGLDGASLVLTSYGTLLRDVDWLAGVRFDTVVLDEAQAIKNPRSKTARATRRLAASHRLALSGTPLENHLGELWSLVEFLNPGMLTWPAFRRVLRWRDAAGRAAGVELLLRLVRPLLLRRTKAEVAPELPPRLEHRILLEPSPEERAAYQDLREHFLRKVELAPVDRRGALLLTAVTRLRQLACHPGLLDPRRTSEGSVKVDLLLDRLESLRGSGRKALVFSQFTALLELLRKRLEGSGHALAYLDGSTRDREEQVRRFQEEPTVGVFLISLKAGGTGLNLTAADDVFLLDPWWNPAVEAQAIDRAHRIGRTRPVMAWKLVVAGTIEERVLELQARKRALAESLFDPTLGGLTEAELLSLL